MQTKTVTVIIGAFLVMEALASLYFVNKQPERLASGIANFFRWLRVAAGFYILSIAAAEKADVR